jgi:hypothetical protein
MVLWAKITLACLGLAACTLASKDGMRLQDSVKGTRADSPEVQIEGDVRGVGRATLREHRGVWIMNLFGTREEMARQHGALIRHQVKETALPFFSAKVRNSIDRSYIVQRFPFLGSVIRSIVEWIAFGPYRKRIPKEDQAVIRAFAEAAGYSQRLTELALVMPDAGQWLVSKIFGKYQVMEGAFSPIGDLGCTSFVIPSGRGRDGFIHARNLDFESYGIFGKFPLVIYFHPADPNELSYMSFTSLGLHTAGITGTNEAGVTVGIHQNFVKAVSLKGTPILSITDHLVRNARSLAYTIDFLRRQKFGGSWNLVISSHRENSAVSVEVSADGMAVVPMEPEGLYRTNHVFSEMMRKKEFFPGYRYYEDTLLRYNNLSRLLSSRWLIGIQDAVDLISSSLHHTGKDQATVENRSSHGIVAKMNNIQSIVFAPNMKVAYVAVPTVKGAKPLEGRYVPMPLRIREMESEGNVRNLLRSMPGDRWGSNHTDENRIHAHALYRNAARIITEEAEFEQGMEMLTQAASLEPSEALYPVIAGILSFRMAAYAKSARERRDVLGQALEFLVHAQELNPDDYQRSLINLFIGRYFDLEGDRGRALTFYGRVSEHYSEQLRQALRKNKKKRYTTGQLNKIVLDFVQGDIARY